MIDFAPAKRISLVALVAILAAACSSLPDWANPDAWGESSEPGTSVTDTSSPADPAPQGATVAEAGDKYPVLADTPDKAPPTTSTDEQKQVANALVGDRTQAQYSAEQLRAGAEAAAAPPPSAEVGAAAASAPPDNSTAGAGGSETTSRDTPTESAAAASASAGAVAPHVTPANAGVPVTRALPMAAPSEDAASGFQPSHAPPLDPSVAQMVGATSHSRLALATAQPTATPAPSVSYGPPAATVTLGNAGAIDANGIAQVQAAVSAFRAKGNQGFVRVVGHADSASSSTRALERAQAGATAVARELIKLGVPAKRVLVEASGTADGGQERADIFLAS